MKNLLMAASLMLALHTAQALPTLQDAQSTPGGDGNPLPVPDASSTVALLGFALLGLAALSKRLAPPK